MGILIIAGGAAGEDQSTIDLTSHHREFQYLTLTLEGKIHNHAAISSSTLSFKIVLEIYKKIEY
jgi:hypothetical protein